MTRKDGFVCMITGEKFGRVIEHQWGFIMGNPYSLFFYLDYSVLVFGSSQMSCYTCFSLLASSSPGTITADGYYGPTALSLSFLYHQTAVQITTLHTCSWQQFGFP